MTEAPTMTLDEIEDLANRALVAAGTSEANAAPLARATAATEADGIASHGLAYIPIYCEHVQCGKVDGQAQPVLSRPAPSVVAVDAATGFAHPAIDLGFETLIPAAREQGVAALAVRNSYNCGVLGYHTGRLAAAGPPGHRLHQCAGLDRAVRRQPAGGRHQSVLAGSPRRCRRRSGPDRPERQRHRQERDHEARAGRACRSRPKAGRSIRTDGRPRTPTWRSKGSMAPSGGYKGVGVAH